ncbi:MAG TPA: hypothetical protein DCK79_06560 [Candidatus Atribacteria bacterium]|jgi:hypothetical protein|nr:hypothetical protein [Candidatus Atribacteria bacterium]
MKKLIIALLVVMLSLGLSGLVYAADQTVEGNVTATISITAPAAISSYTLAASASPASGENVEKTGTADALDANDLKVISNTPYHIQINCDTPTYGTAGYMNKHTGTDYATPAVTLTDPFYWAVNLQEGTTSTTTSTFTQISTTASTIADIDDTATDDDGYLTEIKYSQPVHFSDPVLSGTNKYRIVVTFTAVADSATG